MPAIPALPDTERRTTGTVSASVGPINVGFDIYADSNDYTQWVEVWLDGVKLIAVTDWTLDSPSGVLATLARPITDARITFAVPRTGTYQIVGARRPRRTTQLTEGTGVTARSFNQFVTDIVATARERWDLFKRTPRGVPGETIPEWAPAATRANRYVKFDASGNPVHGETATILEGGSGAAAASAAAAAASAAAAALSAANLTGTSTTSVAIGTGSKLFTTQAGKDFAAGRELEITSDANPTTHRMFGTVTAYSGTSLTVDVEVFEGSGSRADWTIRVCGVRGAEGVAGVAVAPDRTVRVRTTANVDLAGGGLANATTHDGVAVATGNLVLVSSQTAPAENGVYVVPASGAAARDGDFDTFNEHPGAIIAVQEGTAWADTLWLCPSDLGGVLGTTAITFLQFVAKFPLAANTTFFVRTDGSDSNDGLTDSAGGAFLTWQGAYNVIIDRYNFNGKTVTIKAGGTGVRTFAPGSGVNVLNINGSWQGGGALIFEGDLSVKDNVRWNATSADCVRIEGVFHGPVTFKGLRISATGGSGFNHLGAGRVYFSDTTYFVGGNPFIKINNDNSYVGINTGATVEFEADAGSAILVDSGYLGQLGTIAITGTRTFTQLFEVNFRGFAWITTITGTFTGKQYIVKEGATLRSSSASAIPGSLPGTVSVGGLYVDGNAGTAIFGVTSVLAASAVAVSHTGSTTETTLATISVPANAMRANGILRITLQWGKTGTAGTWQPRIKFNGTTYYDGGGTYTGTNLSARQQIQIANRNATNSQVGTSNLQTNFSQNTDAVVTSAHDTTTALNLTITIQLGSAADTVRLEAYLVELLAP